MLNYLIYKVSTTNQIFETATQFKNYHHVLILGAGKKNPIFYSRMNAAINLYRNANIDKIVCSGLTGIINYNEPYDMRDYLLKNNIPDSIIVLDTLGKNTLESITNYSKLYVQDSVIVISQAQHLSRALFIANRKGLHAVGFAASNFNGRYNSEWRLNEFLARIKCSVNLVFGN